MAASSFMNRLRRRLLRDLLKHETRKGSHFMTSRARPKTAAAVGLSPQDSPIHSTAPVELSEPTAIVMQGPIWDGDDFTLETLRLYAKTLPNCRLILSTWKDTPKADLAPFEDMGVDIVLSDKPAIPGPFNVNMQLTGAKAGVEAAVEGGATWILKTRTDNRLYHPAAINGMAATAKAIPPMGEARHTQKHRVFSVGPGSMKFVPYHLCDQTVFGHAVDMKTYWSPPLRDEPLPDDWPGEPGRIYRDVPIRALNMRAAPETYFCSQFLMAQDRALQWTVADGWAAFRDHLGVLDATTVDCYWVKGAAYTMRDDAVVYKGLNNRRQMTFLDLMLLVGGHLRPEDAEPYEAILDECFAVFDPGYP
jgi:hypothetical protein